jgi:hypothetical protein
MCNLNLCQCFNSWFLPTLFVLMRLSPTNSPYGICLIQNRFREVVLFPGHRITYFHYIGEGGHYSNPYLWWKLYILIPEFTWSTRFFSKVGLDDGKHKTVRECDKNNFSNFQFYMLFTFINYFSVFFLHLLITFLWILWLSFAEIVF